MASMDRPTTGPIETDEMARLSGGPTRYLLRRSARARGLRVTVDPRQGLVVTMPTPGRRGWARPDGRVDRFLAAHEGWIVRQLGRFERQRAEVAALGGLRDGGRIYYRGEIHRIRVDEPVHGMRRTSIERVGGDAEDELVIRPTRRERRPIARILEAWFRERAAEAIDVAVAAHAPGLGVAPASVVLRDPATRWGSASRKGRLMFSWRLVLAPPSSLETVVVHELAHLRVPGHGPDFWSLVAGRRPDHRADRAWLRRHSHLLHHSPIRHTRTMPK
jgi:hypothetical protein